MDEAVHVVLGDSLSDPLGTVDVNIHIREILRGVLATNKVVHDIGVTDALLDGLAVPQVVFLYLSDKVSLWRESAGQYHENHSSEVTGNFQVPLRHLLAEGDDNRASLGSWKGQSDPIASSNPSTYRAC